MARRVTRRNHKTRKTRKGGTLETNQQRREREQRERRGRPRERQVPAPRVANYEPVNYRVVLPLQPQPREGAA
jgi:hypothetical protein